LIRWDEERKQIEVEIQTCPKLKELIKFKDLIKLLMGIIDLIKNSIEKNSSFKA
jgi:hypothetical protein